jgi:hypothetical protein
MFNKYFIFSNKMILVKLEEKTISYKFISYLKYHLKNKL